ncbi:TonB-dependent receptor [Sphingomonas sp. C8-2]|jgi:outer membrane receptor protein involved in Fe transport|nr:TonB-dependent receptor [Sphingomonas sp. C8-2]
MIMKRGLLQSAAVALPLLLNAAAASAQQAGSGDDMGLDEIVVTAQKRSQNLQEVPIALVAASGDALVSSGISSTQQLNTLAPGLNVRTTAGSFQPSIRGIGTSSNVVENPVALYIDGVYYPQQREGVRDLNDVEQIAVLKGPQGTLFGRNATGGVIQITTKKPRHEFEGQAGVQIDNYATVKGDVYMTGGLSDTLAASLSAQYATQGDGWGKNLTTGRDTFKIEHQFAARGKLLFEPGPNTDVTLIGDYSDWRQLTNSFQPYPGTSYSIPGIGPLGSVYDTYASREGFVAFKGGGLSLTIDHDLDFAKFSSISAWRKGKSSFLFDNTNVPQPLFLVETPDGPNESFSQEVQLIGSGDRLNWVAGLFYFHSSYGARPIRRIFSGVLAPLPTSTAVSSTSGEEVAESIAPFGQIDWKFLPRTTLTLGARYTYEKRRIDSATTLTLVNGAIVAPPGRKESSSIEKPTFRVAISHEITDDVLGYLSFNTGIKSGGYNVINPANAAYQPEKLTAYEAGLKTELLDRRLRLNMAGFYYDYTNLQVIQFSGGIQAIVNGAKAELYGFDVDFEAQLGGGFHATGGFEYLHSKFKDFPNAVFSTPRPGGGAILSSANAAGNRLPLAQKLTATGSLDYHSDLAKGEVDLNLTANYNGAYYFEPDNFLRQGAYVMLNASAKWTAPSGRFSLMVWGRNLLNEHVITQAPTQSFGYVATYGSPPRTYGVTARVNF